MKLLKVRILSFFLGCLALTVQAQRRSAEELRLDFHASILDEHKIPEFYAAISSIPEPNALETAYLGAAEAMMAKTTWNPLDKVKRLKLFQSYLEKAVRKDMDNLEIRFLRFSIEYHIPKWLGLSKNMHEDKEKMVQGIASMNHLEVDQKFIKYIMYFLNQTGSCTSEELDLIKSKITSWFTI